MLCLSLPLSARRLPPWPRNNPSSSGDYPMGKPTGFLEIDRRDRTYDKVGARLKTWKEFVQPLALPEVGRQAARCMDCGIPFCHQGCPVNNQIPDFNNLVYRDQWRQALTVLHSTNNFPEFTGRVCPAPCET